MDERAAQLRAKNARLMEPDDDLRMPVGQKVVLIVLAVIVLVVVVSLWLGH